MVTDDIDLERERTTTIFALNCILGDGRVSENGRCGADKHVIVWEKDGIQVTMNTIYWENSVLIKMVFLVAYAKGKLITSERRWF